MAKLNETQRLIDAQIRRINRKLASFAALGTESRQYQQVETILMNKETSWGTLSGEMTLRNKDGMLQLSRTKAALNMFSLDEYQRVLRQLDRLQSAGAAKRAMIKAYKERTGVKPKTKAEKEAAVAAEIAHYQSIQRRLEKAAGEMYKIEKERGIRFEAHSMMQKKSKGRWTSNKTLEEMLDAVEAVVRGEDQRIVKNALEGW